MSQAKTTDPPIPPVGSRAPLTCRRLTKSFGDETTASIEGEQPDDRAINLEGVMVSASIRLLRSLMQRVPERAAEAGASRA